MSLQRSLQKGRQREAGLQGTALPQVGQVTLGVALVFPEFIRRRSK
jgi:hypothetical protein